MDLSFEARHVDRGNYNIQISRPSTGASGREAPAKQPGEGKGRQDRLGPDWLTKSRYMTGRSDGARQMWFEARGAITPGVGDRWRMEQGTAVAALARSRFPDGKFVGGRPSDEDLRSERPLFEARFSAEKMAVRVDVLRPAAPSEADAGDRWWTITEVKSSTLSRNSSEKDALRDVGFQVFVLEEAGIPVAGAEVMHLNPEYTHPGGGKPLFTTKDLTDQMGEIRGEVAEEAPKLARALRQDAPPNLWPSRTCNTCDCPDPCHDLPEHSVLTLPRYYYQPHLQEIIDDGCWTIDELEGHPNLKPRHENYVRAVQSGEDVAEEGEIRRALGELEYPLYFLDFEAVGYALPRYEGTSPWDKIPFQYSLHVAPDPETPLTEEAVSHHDHLHDGSGDPRPELTRRLLEDIGPSGSIVVYNKTFEKGILEDLRDAFPERSVRLESMIERLWDQAEIFKNGHYVPPEAKGSYSLKKILPAFDPTMSYGDLDVQEGMEAVVEYAKTVASETPAGEAEKIRATLLEYCKRDTWAMVVIHHELAAIAGSR